MARMHEAQPSAASTAVWQCIGCGRIEMPASCVGICQDRRIEIVSARDYADLRAALVDANTRIGALESLVERLANVTPREGAWKACFVALQADARQLLESPDDAEPF